jgi:hypothetical protein
VSHQHKPTRLNGYGLVSDFQVRKPEQLRASIL